jgi:ornithine lipid hydroxylase
MQLMRHFIRFGLFPTTFAIALWGAHTAFLSGYDKSLILTAVTLGTILTVALGEWLLPHYASWSKSHGDVPTDLAHNVVSMVILPPVIETMIRATLLRLSASLAAAYGANLWPESWPMALQLGLALIICQLGEYWAHRLMHEQPLLWRLHAIHHSAPRLYWLNAGRFHPLDVAILFTISMVPLMVLGVNEEVLLLFTTWVSVHGLFQHCNIDLKLGPLNYVFSMAELHRWHHSRTLEEANSNYGNNIIFWDLVFGTFFNPADRQAQEDIGLSDMPNFPQDYLGQVTAPFRWDQLSEEQP